VQPVACRFCIAIGSLWCHPIAVSPPQPPSWFWLWPVPLGVLLAQPYSELAAVGQGGQQINEPGTSRSLKTLPGTWSDLAMACLIHVGMKRLLPEEDSGLGIGAEYEEAGWLHQG